MVGKIINDRYEIIEQIGQGGMAKVYKAKCNVLNRFVAIKILKDEYIDDDTFSKKFKKESQAAASISHPNIVNVYDVGNFSTQKGNIPYIVMEYIDGETLKDIISRKGKLDSETTVFYSLQIAEAIKHAHSNNIIHRDIKPHNIMVDKNNRIKVTDFGIARAVTSSTVTIGADTLGSVHYISPEQARGGYTDEKSDIYSLGIVMYEMVTGKQPFVADTAVAVALKHVQDEITPPSEVEEGIPENLEAIILKSTSKSQSDRYQEMSALINDLENIDATFVGTVGNKESMEDSPTMIIPPVNDEGSEAGIKKDQNKNNKEEKSGTKTTLLAILLAFLVVGTMFFAYFQLKDGFADSEVIVPDFLGIDIEEAESEAEELGLELVINDRLESDEYEEGQVIKQDQEPGSKVKEGYKIGVIISEGGKLIKLPNFTNETLEDAMNTLDELELIVGDVKYEFSAVVPEESIISQSPKPYTSLSKGDKIILTVSKGEEEKTVVMPKLIGRNLIDAQNKILGIGLNVGNVKKEYNNEYPEGVVFFQSSNEGENLQSGTSIDLYVSKGPESEPEPEPEPEPQPEPEPEPVEGDIRFIVSLPDTTEGEEVKDVKVTIKRTQDGENKTVYDKMHKANGNEVEVTSKGKKGSKFEIYFDGELKQTKIKQE